MIGVQHLQNHVFLTFVSCIFNISSQPCALLTFKFLIILRISSFSKEIEFNLEWVLKHIVEGKTLLLVKGVHWAAKKLLKHLPSL